MVTTINNSEMKRAFRDSVKSQMNDEPNVVDNSRVIPTIDITPRNHQVINFVKSASCTNATSANVVTTNSKQETYITNVLLNYTKDATSTATILQLLAVINGEAVALASFRTLTLTAANNSLSVNFPYPIKVDKSSTITISSDTAVANITVRGTVFGFTVDSL